VLWLPIAICHWRERRLVCIRGCVKIFFSLIFFEIFHHAYYKPKK
jgi:hypothetical protein